MAGAERAGADLDLLPIQKKVARFTAAVIGRDDPGALERIPAEF
jgi:hypothetical protein